MILSLALKKEVEFRQCYLLGVEIINNVRKIIIKRCTFVSFPYYGRVNLNKTYCVITKSLLNPRTLTSNHTSRILFASFSKYVFDSVFKDPF